MGETTKAAVPGADVEAGADMGKNVLKGIGNSLKIALVESDLGPEFVSQVVDLFLEDEGFLQKVDDDVKSLSDLDEVGAELRSLLVLDVQLLQQLSGLGMLLSQLVEDGGHDLHFAVGVRRVPDLMPHMCHLLLVLHGAAVIIGGVGSCHGQGGD